jgi:hypothetical protein
MKAMYGLACRAMFLTNRNPNFVAAPGMKSSKNASRNTCLLPLRSDLIISALTCNIKYHIHSLRYAVRFEWLHKPCNQVQGYLIAKNRLCMLEVPFRQPPCFSMHLYNVYSATTFLLQHALYHFSSSYISCILSSWHVYTGNLSIDCLRSWLECC